MSTQQVVPSRLQTRVVSLVAGVLPQVTPLPVALRKVVGFAPARRARAGGVAIWEALADDEFRSRAALQVAAQLGETPADPLDRAVTAWLQRPEGWDESLREALAEVSVDREDSERHLAEATRLREQVSSLQADLRDVRAQHRQRENELRSEIADLRRKLGEARAGRREAVAQAEASVAEATTLRADAIRAKERADGDVRRLQERLDALQASDAGARREARTDRDAASARAWYLLDALHESAVGLRRELGLPAPAAAPGEAIESALRGEYSTSKSRTVTTPMLENLLAMPRARLIIDGYNVTKTAWPSATLEAQRSRLVAALAPVVARTGAETTVVFDAGSAGARPAMPAPRGVRVVFSPPDVIADDIIRQLVLAEPMGRTLLVVTNDRAVVVDVIREGARAVASEVLVDLLSSR